LCAPLLAAIAGCVVEHSNAPSGPLSGRPADTPRSSARAVVTVKPLGSVRYDGLTLPLVSPDGRYLAVSQGQPPSWEALLDDASPADAAAPSNAAPSIVVYDLSTDAPVPATSQPVLLPGTLLGRSADSAGFLVERPLDDGSRWIGKVSWPGANSPSAIRWLVADEHRNAGASLGPRGELAWTRTRVGASFSELVFRDRADDRSREQRWSDPLFLPLFPVLFGPCADGTAPGEGNTQAALWVFLAPQLAGPARATLAVMQLAWPERSDEALREIQRVSTGAPATRLGAFQCVSAVQTPRCTRTAPSAGLVYFDPALAGMAWIPAKSASSEPARTGDVDPAYSQAPLGAAPRPILIAPKSLGAVAIDAQSRFIPEFLVAEPEALCYRRLDTPKARSESSRIELLKGTFVPLRLRTGSLDCLLLAPPTQGEDSVMRLLRLTDPGATSGQENKR
jgi:hypothetical protein